MSSIDRYAHTQRGKLHWLLGIMGIGTLIGALVVPELLRQQQQQNPHMAPGWGGVPNMVAVTLLIWGAVCMLLALAFARLTVRDRGDALFVQFGPLPLLWRSIPYAKITAVERDRTRVIDGWGVHWVPTRGTTYNIDGTDCVKITLGRSVVRVGSDDADNLLAFLKERLAEQQQAAEDPAPEPVSDADGSPPLSEQESGEQVTGDQRTAD